MPVLMILSVIFLSGEVEAGGDIVIPKITYSVSISPSAQSKITQENRKIVADVYYEGDFGEGDPQTEIASTQIEIPPTGGDVTAPELNFSETLRELKAQKGLSAKFSALEFSNIYNPPTENQFNLISCEVTPGALFNLRALRKLKEIKVNAVCKLIGEN